MLEDTKHNETADIVIKLEDQNDNDPEFNQTSYYFNISENATNWTRVGNVTVSDLHRSRGRMKYAD